MNTHEFDYVVVGGGTAGNVVAARLSEDPSITGCVLEAGPSDVGEDDILRPERWMGLLESATTGTTPSSRRPAATASCGPPATRCSAAVPPTTAASPSGARRGPRRVGGRGLYGLEHRRPLPAVPAAGEQRRPGLPPRPHRPGEAAHAEDRRSVRHGPAGGVRQLVPDQRPRERHAPVVPCGVPAPGPGQTAQPGGSDASTRQEAPRATAGP